MTKNDNDSKNKKFFNGKTSSSSASTITAPKVNEIENEIGDFNFDDLDAIEKKLDLNEIEKNNIDDQPEGKKTMSQSLWTSLTGGGKAAKFKA